MDKEWKVEYTIEGKTSFFCDTKEEAEKKHMITCRNYAKAYTPIAVQIAMKLRIYTATQMIEPQEARIRND